MTSPKVPFFKPFIGEDEINEVVDSLRNGWLTTGAKTHRFEKEFGEYLGGDVHCVAVNSATAGLHLALEAIGIGPGDEVIVPDYTFTATAEVVRYLGADPIFVDVDYATLNIMATEVEAAITKKTKAIMPVHFAGLACDMTPLIQLAKKHDLKIVEDAAHSLPASSDGVRVGQFSTDAAVFSFYANKTITTGEGGMLVTKNAAIAERAQKMRLHGFDRNSFDRFKTGNWSYDIVAPGYKYNMTDIAASLGLHQLAKVDYFQSERQRVCEKYDKGLAGLPLDLPAHPKEGDVHSWHLYIIRLNEDANIERTAFFQRLADAGITCSVHYTPLHRFTYWRETYDLKGQDFPQSERAGQNCISLPLYVNMPDDEIEYVIETVKAILQ